MSACIQEYIYIYRERAAGLPLTFLTIVVFFFLHGFILTKYNKEIQKRKKTIKVRKTITFIKT